MVNEGDGWLIAWDEERVNIFKIPTVLFSLAGWFAQECRCELDRPVRTCSLRAVLRNRLFEKGRKSRATSRPGVGCRSHA